MIEMSRIIRENKNIVIKKRENKIEIMIKRGKRVEMVMIDIRMIE